MNLRNEFITWYFNEFPETQLFQDMLETVEDSPWHREGNVGIHTNMVVSQYLALNNSDDWNEDYSKSNNHTNLLGAFACAFHDVGKPAAMERKYTEERGHYNAFAGHEPVSARLWENWAVENWDMLVDRFRFNGKDLYIVGWMVENHLPWGLKKDAKLDSLGLTIALNEVHNTFFDVLMADTLGRISDDHPDKIAKSQAWVDAMRQRARAVGIEYLGRSDKKSGQPKIVIPIGASGSGKTTVFNENFADFEHFSWDTSRIQFTEENLGFADGLSDENKYRIAFDYCNENRDEFTKYWQAQFHQLIKDGKNIYVDNTNLSKKRRKFFLDAVMHKGYKTTAVIMPVTLKTVLERQKTRTDKTVPEGAVMQHYMAMQYPWYGEFDEIIVKM